MKYKFFTTSEKAWDAMLEAIRGAQSSIYMEMYILADDTPQHDFFGLLKQKAREGVKTKIVIDSFGSSELKPAVINDLRNAGIEVLRFSYWLYHTHRKILVVDGKLAFLGGVNIYKFFQKWNDLQVRIEGPVVKYITKSFIKAYRLCGGKDSISSAYNGKKDGNGDRKLFFWDNWPRDGITPLMNIYKKKLDAAKQSVVIVTPYFAPRRWLIARLHQASLRGVDVRVIFPREADHWLFNRANYFYASFVNSLGIKFYLQPEMIHAKIMLVDGREGVVGSQNTDLLSFDYNTEAGVFFSDGEMIGELNGVIEKWQADAAIFDPTTYRRRWYDRIFAPIGRLARLIVFWGVV